MKGSTKIWIIGGVVLLFGILLYLFGSKNTGNKVSSNWTENYRPSNEGPYGTYMLKELLDTVGLFGEFLDLGDELENVLVDDPDVNDIYFFVGLRSYLKKGDVDYLLEFVEEGNTAFIATEDFPNALLREICDDRNEFYDETVKDSTQFFKYTHPELQNQRYKFEFVYQNEKDIRNWVYLNEESLVDGAYQHANVLGSNTRGKVNFIKITFGEGEIFLHSNPYAFSNISLMKRDGFAYSERLLEHIPPGRVQWDRYYLTSHYQNSSGDSGEERRSMVEFLLKFPTLIWALCILLIGAFLYAVFKGKRMQKIIPASESKENTSMRYINTLASLYLQKSKHSKLIRLKEKTFLNFIAEKYYITTQKADLKFIEKVSVKSQISEEKIMEIFDLFKKLNNNSEVSDDALILLHKKIENFYKKCR